MPDASQSVPFDVALRGYDRDQVDAHLASLESEFSGALSERDRLAAPPGIPAVVGGAVLEQPPDGSILPPGGPRGRHLRGPPRRNGTGHAVGRSDQCTSERSTYCRMPSLR